MEDNTRFKKKKRREEIKKVPTLRYRYAHHIHGVSIFELITREKKGRKGKKGKRNFEEKGRRRITALSG